MSITNMLNIGRHALGAYQAAMDVSSQNAANAGVEGYSRRRGTLSSLGLGRDRRTSAGVMMSAPERVIDQYSTASTRQAQANASYQESRLSALQQLESILAPQDGGLALRIEELLDSFSRLSSQPGGFAERESVLYAAEGLADDFQATRSQLARLRDPISGLVSGQVDEINDLTVDIAELNALIRSAEAAQGEASELRDERDELLDRLSELTGAQMLEQDDGTVTASLPSGAVLVSSEMASELDTREINGQIELVLYSSEGAERVLKPDSAGGELGGTLTSFNEDMGQAVDTLDQIAYGLATTINDLHSQGFGLDGATGRGLFADLAGPEGAAALLAVSADLVDNPDGVAATRSAGQLPGGSDLALELSKLRDAPIASLDNRSAFGALTDLRTDTGRSLNRASAETRIAEGQVEAFSNVRESVRGVSLDEELSDLLKHQRGYEAASRVVRAADEMMQTILNLV
ncbi:MAG: flagellar hook-associated protein FlgK [Myxococcota bacterium]